MKQILLTLLTCYSFLICSDSELKTISFVQGRILNDTVNSITIGGTCVHIEKNGRFLHLLELTEPEKVEVTYKGLRFELFLEPGEKIELSFDAENIDQSMTFKGSSADTNRYLYEMNNTYSGLINYFRAGSSEWRELFSKNEQDFIDKLGSLMALFRKASTDRLIAQARINRVVLFNTEKGIQFTFDWMLSQYPQYHRVYTGNKV